MSNPAYDLVVIGAGPGGYVAALRAAQLKMRVAIVEREHLGGICLNWGCIPTKALLHAADTLRRIRDAGTLGIELTGVGFNLVRMIERSRTVARQLSGGVKLLLRKAGVDILEGSARLAPGGGVEVGATSGPCLLTAAHVILATGARPRELPQLPFDGNRIWNYRDALQPRSLPDSLLIVGGGAIGLEFAGFYAALGSKVTLVEVQPRILPEGDEEVSNFLAAAYEREGIAVRTGVRVDTGEVGPDGVITRIVQGGTVEQLHTSHVLVAVGLVGNTEGLGLEHTGVQLRGSEIKADAWGATADPRISAVGDVTGAPMLAHRASHQGVACVERIAGLRSASDLREMIVPSCTYSHPQTASVGWTEQKALHAGRAVKVGRFPLIGNGKAVAIGDVQGFVKTIFDAGSGELLGAHIVGPDATELIQGYVIAAGLESTEHELIDTVFAHPTLSEAMHESVLAAFGRALHI